MRFLLNGIKHWRGLQQVFAHTGSWMLVFADKPGAVAPGDQPHRFETDN